MHFTVVLTIFIHAAFGVPISPGHFNAHADDFGMAVVDIEKDVILSPGKGGNNFNAESENNAQAVVTVGGAVHGFATNRTGEEFNAVSKKQGVSQVRVNGDLFIENLDPSVKKFDASSESHGQSLVQVGNVVVVAGARGGKHLRRDVKDGIDQAPWGAAAVAEQNSKPWETINHGPDATPVGDSPISSLVPDSNLHVDQPTGSSVSSVEPSPVTEVSPAAPHEEHVPIPGSESETLPHPTEGQNHSSVPTENTSAPTTFTTSEASTFETSTIVPVVTDAPKPHSTEIVPIITDAPKPRPTEIVPESTTHSNITIIDENPVHVIHPSGGYQIGSLNAVSKGQGSKSMVQVKGFVQY